jgi:hypothetical protein
MTMEMLCHPLEDASAWKADDLAEMDWTITLDADDIAELELAVAAVRASGFSGRDFGRGDFPLPRLQIKVRQAMALLTDGPGVARFRGFPVDRFDATEMEVAYWGIGVHFGLPMGQNRRGDRLGVVQASAGKDAYSQKVSRGYDRPSALPFHADSTDIVALLCVRKGLSGGQSLVASMAAIHNHLLLNRPDLLPVLYEGMHTALGEDGPTRTPGEISPWPVPIFEYHNGNLNAWFARPRYLASQELFGRPFTPLQLEALQYVEDLARSEVFHFAMTLEPGDIQFLNNYVVVHSRTDYVDHDDPARLRRLLRLWLRIDQEDYRLSPHRAHIFRWGIDAVRPTMV